MKDRRGQRWLPLTREGFVLQCIYVAGFLVQVVYVGTQPFDADMLQWGAGGLICWATGILMRVAIALRALISLQTDVRIAMDEKNPEPGPLDHFIGTPHPPAPTGQCDDWRQENSAAVAMW